MCSHTRKSTHMSGLCFPPGKGVSILNINTTKELTCISYWRSSGALYKIFLVLVKNHEMVKDGNTRGNYPYLSVHYIPSMPLFVIAYSHGSVNPMSLPGQQLCFHKETLRREEVLKTIQKSAEYRQWNQIGWVTYSVIRYNITMNYYFM